MSLSIIIQITRKKNKRINQARNEKLNDPFYCSTYRLASLAFLKLANLLQGNH